MTICDEIETRGSLGLSRIVRPLLFLIMQGVAVILVGFAALFLSFEPVWSADAASANFCEARRRTLRLPALENR